jgi:hypothetical protein
MFTRICMTALLSVLAMLGLGPCNLGCQSPTSQVPTMTGRGVQDVKQGAIVTDGRVTITPYIVQSPNEGSAASSTISPGTQPSR